MLGIRSQVVSLFAVTLLEVYIQNSKTFGKINNYYVIIFIFFIETIGCLNALEIQFAKVQLPSLNFDSYGLNFDPQLVIESGMIMAIAKDLGNFNTYGSVQNGVRKIS